MLIRTLICAGCMCLLAGSASSLFAEPVAVFQCCEVVGDCGSGLRCCDPIPLGKPLCSAELEWQCMVACMPSEE